MSASDRDPARTSAVLRDRLEAMLLGGAIGDALGAPLEFLDLRQIHALAGPEGPSGFFPAYGRRGAITDDTQMTLFTAEGLIRAHTRATLKGICHVPTVIRFAYLRWLDTQEIEPHPQDLEHADTWRNGWLRLEPDLRHQRVPGATCIGGLLDGRMGSPELRLNDSKGCGGVMRVAPVAAVHLQGSDAFRMGCEAAALTHGHPTGYLAAGTLALVLGHVLAGAPLPVALEQARARLRSERHHEETERALDAAVRLAGSGTRPGPDAVRSLGAGWIAEEALAIAVYCALVAPDVLSGLRLAVTHPGDCDSTGAIAGNLLGALHGTAALPPDLVRDVEARDVIRRVAHDLFTHLVERPPGLAERDGERYPGL